MQHVVSEVLELLIRRFGSIGVELDMFKKQLNPVLLIFRRQVAQRIQRQLVVRAGAFVSVQCSEQKVHWAAGELPDSSQRRRHGAITPSRIQD